MSLQHKTESKLTEYAAETSIYFERYKLNEVLKKILIECALHQPSSPRQWIGKNMKPIAKEIYKRQYEHELKPVHLSTNFLHRILIFGRPGCGSKTQAYNLAATFNLVYIDAEALIHQHLRGSEEMKQYLFDRELQIAFYYDKCSEKSKVLLNIIARRILEKDCINRGWVLINFAHTLQNFRDIVENFKIPPNKLVYLKCNERICMQRIKNMRSLCVCVEKTNQKYKYYEYEMRFFNHHKAGIIEYLLKRCETICVIASESAEKVKRVLLSSIIKSPHVMGFKQNTGN